MYVVAINNYAYIVPFIDSENERFLKTIFPSRKYTSIERKSRMPQIQGVQGWSRSKLLRTLGNAGDGVSSAILLNWGISSIRSKHNEEILDHAKIKADFLPFLESCISSINEI